MTLSELVVKLGFSADTFKVKDFVKSLGELPVTAAAGIASLAEIEHQIVKVAQEAMNMAVGFQMFTSQTGLSWQQLQKWQIVAQQANVSADAVAQSVEALQRNMAAIKLGGGNIAPFQMLGIGVNQNAFQVLDQLRQRIKGIDRATATNIITQMGLTPEMMQVLTLSDEKFAQLSKTVSGMTGGEEASFLKLKEQLVQVGLAVRYLSFSVIGHFIDQFELLLSKIKEFHMWTPGLIAAGAAIAIAFAPATAGIVALLLVLDDLAVYFEGGDSVIGLAIEGIKKLGKALENEIPKGVLDNLGKITAVAGALINPIGAATGAISGAVQHVINQTNHIAVHSTAPAHDVAKAVKHEIDKGVSAAALQTNNQGY